MAGARSTLMSWAARGAIPAERLPEALEVAGVLPTARAWRRFLDGLSLWLGAAALGAALIFFVAANWAAIGVWGKFALVEVATSLPELGGLRRFMLATLDAHGLYRRFGFAEPSRPDLLLERVDPAPGVYRRRLN